MPDSICLKPRAGRNSLALLFLIGRRTDGGLDYDGVGNGEDTSWKAWRDPSARTRRRTLGT